MILTYETVKISNNGRITPRIKNTSSNNTIPNNDKKQNNNLEKTINKQPNTDYPIIDNSKIEKLPIFLTIKNV